jgi:hypothetical protein
MLKEVFNTSFAASMGINGAILTAFPGARGYLHGSSFRKARCFALSSSLHKMSKT